MIEKFREFTSLILSLNRAIKKIKTEEMSDYNLKSVHVSCLYYIRKASSITAKDLVMLCGEDKASISRALSFLDNQGYIVCDNGANKKYKATISLTEKGNEVATLIHHKTDSALAKAGAGVNDEDREVMYRSLKTINDNLNKLCEKYD